MSKKPLDLRLKSEEHYSKLFVETTENDRETIISYSQLHPKQTVTCYICRRHITCTGQVAAVYSLRVNIILKRNMIFFCFC